MLFHTGEFEKNLTVFFKLLDVWSHHAELVDTAAEHIGRAADTVFYLAAQSSLDGSVVVAALNLVLEHHGEVALRSSLRYCWQNIAT